MTIKHNPAQFVRKTDPGLFDMLVGFGAAAAQRTTRRHKWGARAMQVDRSRWTRYAGGDEHGPFTGAVLTAYRLARDPQCNPYSLITEQLAVIQQARLEEWTPEQLRARERELTDLEHTLEAQENRRTQMLSHDNDWLGAADADIAKAEVHLERAAVRREIARRLQP